MNTNMSDEDFFEFYCASANVVYHNGDRQVVFIKNSEFKFCYVTQAYHEGLHPKGAVSLNILDKKNETMHIQVAEELLAKAHKQDERIKATLKPQNYLYVDIYDRILKIRKRPIINPATNNFVGILGEVTPFMLPNVLNLICKMHGLNLEAINLGPEMPIEYELTEKQHMVLFLYVYKYTSGEISLIMTMLGLQISLGRVKDHLENLKYIFSIKTKEQLIAKALKLRYHLFVPRQFLKAGSFELDDELIISAK